MLSCNDKLKRTNLYAHMFWSMFKLFMYVICGIQHAGYIITFILITRTLS